MVVTLIAMTPNRAIPRTVSMAAMRSEGAIGPVRDASPSWNWALIDCNIAISHLVPTWESVHCTIRDEASLPNVGYLRFPTWRTFTIGLAALGPFRPFAALQRHGSYWGSTGPIADIANPTRLDPLRK